MKVVLSAKVWLLGGMGLALFCPDLQAQQTTATAVGKVSSGESTERKNSDVTAEEDPYLWLEDVTGEKSLDWVRARNAKTQQKYETPEFATLRDDLLKILDSNERIPFVSKSGEFYYNFWRDQKNPRGLWRRCTLEEYRKSEPTWDVIVDLDRISKEEGENWVWSSAALLRPDYDRALIRLSRGGADASVMREFDMTTRSFVKDGFVLEEAKGGMGWIDKDTVFVSTNFGEGSMTTSGYPRIAKRWKRGTPLAEAKTIYEGEMTDMSISAMHDDTPGYERNFVSRNIAFYNNELYLLNEDDTLSKIDVPNSISKAVQKSHLFLELREAWEAGGKTYEAGSLLVIRFDDFMSGKRDFRILFQPSENSSLASFSLTKDYLILNVMEDVKNRLYVVTPGNEEWKQEPFQGAPELGTVSVRAIDSDENNDYWMTSSDYLTPTTLSIGTIGKTPSKLKQLTAQFDATGLKASQHFATSKDGTRIPYFLVGREDMKLDGSNPVLLYGYGGFEISLTPGYSATVGRGWLNAGGVYVVANIRGGGEYGPRWHQAALKANRLRAYEDFAAVGEDLIKRGVTSHEHLGIQGGSNGGLLVGNMVALYPDLFSAAVCQVPLLDMRRFHLLLAGASWMAEYGNPDAPGEWSFIQTYSPYQNIHKTTKYPAVLFTTSTRDDRVHPGHARKMMALMESMGHDVSYYENIEGGHGGAANNEQRAYMTALAYTFLQDRLFIPETATK